jgi:hypothetical protein
MRRASRRVLASPDRRRSPDCVTYLPNLARAERTAAFAASRFARDPLEA